MATTIALSVIQKIGTISSSSVFQTSAEKVRPLSSMLTTIHKKINAVQIAAFRNNCREYERNCCFQGRFFQAAYINTTKTQKTYHSGNNRNQLFIGKGI
ncbi:hypothetical protein [Chitinophaga caseinilytica]|uniref:Uncharacterized protein n=1 Tax=Chitinophaga caseinilytica TaxID=2267521 RepID=A0ABZ2Z0V1_9BACT